MDKRALVRAWKDQPPPAGVFQVVRLDTGRTFLGTAENLPGILNSTRFQLESGTFGCADLQADWRALGASAFRIEVVEEVVPTAEKPVTRADRETLRDLVADRLSGAGVARYN